MTSVFNTYRAKPDVTSLLTVLSPARLADMVCNRNLSPEMRDVCKAVLESRVEEMGEFWSTYPTEDRALILGALAL